MKPPAQTKHAEIRIRLADHGVHAYGQEPPHLPLSATDRTELARLAKIIDYKSAKTQIFAQGEKARFIFLLVDGVVQISRTLPDGDRHILAFHWPGDLFGLEETGLYVNAAETVTPCTVYQFPLRKLEAFLLENPNIQQGFLVKAMHNLRAAQRQLIVMGRFDLTRALAAFLLDCSGHAHYFDPAAHVLAIPMTRYDIADYLGTSAESVTRALGELERNNLLRRLNPRSVKLELARLRNFVNLE